MPPLHQESLSAANLGEQHLGQFRNTKGNYKTCAALSCSGFSIWGMVYCRYNAVHLFYASMKIRYLKDEQ